jgi:HEAT repeat protein
MLGASDFDPAKVFDAINKDNAALVANYPELIEAYIELLKGSDPEIRLTTMEILGPLVGHLSDEKQQEVLPLVLSLLQDDPDLRVRAQTADSIYHMGRKMKSDPKMLDALLGAIQNGPSKEEALIRYNALRAIEAPLAYPDPEAAKAKITSMLLSSGLVDADAGTRRMAMVAAAPLILDVPEIRTKMEELRDNDPNKSARHEANEMLNDRGISKPRGSRRTDADGTTVPPR